MVSRSECVYRLFKAVCLCLIVNLNFFLFHQPPPAARRMREEAVNGAQIGTEISVKIYNHIIVMWCEIKCKIACRSLGFVSLWRRNGGRRRVVVVLMCPPPV